jgi:hypothetical protein
VAEGQVDEAMVWQSSRDQGRFNAPQIGTQGRRLVLPMQLEHSNNH